MTQSPPAVPTTASIPGVPAGLTERLRSLRDALLVGLVERDVAIRLALIAALAGEHLLLLGPPGTAKSLVAQRLRLAFRDASFFERLLTRFTVPEELFGPLSISALEQDRYQRMTDRYLPTASIAFLDEIFKANSAILNALLTLLNEREFDNGAERVRTPLIAVVGASNEVPGDEDGLEALFDRFLLRLHVGPVSKEGFRSLLDLRGEASPDVPEALRLGPDELTAVQRAAAGVKLSEDVVALLAELREWCAGQQIPVSDRRWRKVVKLLQVSALTNGFDETSVWDCWLLQHCLGDTHDHRKAVYDWYAVRVGAKTAMDPSRLTKIIVHFEAKLRHDAESRSQMRDADGRLLFVDAQGNFTADGREPLQKRRGNELLFLAPANTMQSRWEPMADRTRGGNGYTRAELDQLTLETNERFSYWNGRNDYLADPNNRLLDRPNVLPAMEPTRQKPDYVRSCLRELQELERRVRAYEGDLASHMTMLEQRIQRHLWVTADFVEPARESLQETQRSVAELVSRVRALQRGFEGLPVEGLVVPTARATTQAAPVSAKPTDAVRGDDEWGDCPGDDDVV